MDKDPELSRIDRLRQHAFYVSPEGRRAIARIAGAAVVIDSGETTIGAGALAPITPEDPELHRVYRKWLARSRHSDSNGA